MLGMSGSSSSPCDAGDDAMPEAPETFVGDLAAWYRFDKAAHYLLVAQAAARNGTEMVSRSCLLLINNTNIDDDDQNHCSWTRHVLACLACAEQARLPACPTSCLMPCAWYAVTGSALIEHQSAQRCVSLTHYPCALVYPSTGASKLAPGSSTSSG